jgi:hypothetical protein
VLSGVVCFFIKIYFFPFFYLVIQSWRHQR